MATAIITTACRAVLLAVVAVLLLSPSSTLVRQVAGEGAGEALAHASICLDLILQLQGSSVFILPDSSLVVDFNGTLYGANATVYEIVPPPAEPSDANGTNSPGSGAASPIVEGTSASTAAVPGLKTIQILKEDLVGNGTIISDFETFEGSTTLMGELIALQNSVQAYALPPDCQGYDLTPENENAGSLTSSDTIVFTTTNEAGITITTTCVDQVTALDHAIVRVHVVGDETEAYLDENNVMQGYVGQTFGHIQAAVTNLTYEHHNLTLDSLIHYPMSPWDACIWDLHEDKVDLCIGEFFDTPERRELTEFSALIQLKSVILVMPKAAGAVSFTTLLAPFSKELWLCILGVILLHSFLLWLFNFRKTSSNFDEGFSEFKRLGHSIHLSLQSVFAASMVTDQAVPSLAEYWLSAGFALFIVVIVAAYTANLAAMMTISNFNSQFESLDQLVGAGHSICVQTSLLEPLQVYAGKPIPIVATSSATETLEGIDNGLCYGAVLQMDAMHYTSEFHCQHMVMVGEPLFSLPTGVPVRMKYEGLVSKWISSLRVTGVISNYFSDMLASIAPEECEAITQETAEEDAMTVKAAAGLLIMTVAIFAVACGCAILERCFRKAKKSAKLKALLSVTKSSESAPRVKCDIESMASSRLEAAFGDEPRYSEDTLSGKEGGLEAIMQEIQQLNSAQLVAQQRLRHYLEENALRG